MQAITLRKRLAPSWHSVGAASFLLAPLSGVAGIDVMPEWKLTRKHQTLTGRGVELVLIDAVRDWKGVQDENGEALPFDADALGDLPLQVRLELAGEIMRRFFLSEAEKKTSRSP